MNIANNTNMLITRTFDIGIVAKYSGLASKNMNAIEKINYPDNLQLRHHHDDEIAELVNWMRLRRNDDNVTLSSLHNAIIMNEKLDSLIRSIFN